MSVKRIFLFKLAKPDHRQQLVVDSGFRCHLTSFARTTAAAPSGFVTRLRKFLRTRRVTGVRQVGTDRILEFQFSDGQYHLFLEFYAAGNVVLTDNEFKVIAVLRNVHEGAEHEHLRMGTQYNLSERQNINGIPPLSAQRVKDGLQRFLDRPSNTQNVSSRKIRKKEGDNLRKALAGSITEFPPIFLDHALRLTGFDISLSPEEVLQNENLIDRVLKSIEEAYRTTSEIMSTEKPVGYIIGKPMNLSRSQTESKEKVQPDTLQSQVMYNDFHPFRPKQAETDPEAVILEFEGFNRTVDEFFSSIEGQKLESRLQEKKETARRKMEHARQDQEKRLGGLQQVQELSVRKAQAIEANLDRVEEATAAVNGLIAQGMDWIEIEKLIEIEKNRSNPVAEIIKLPLKLQENTVALMLGEWEVQDDEQEGDSTESEPSDSDEEGSSKQDTVNRKKPNEAQKQEDKRLAVDIDLALSAWSNARDYYDQRRTAAAKEQKTIQAATRALKSQQQKADADLKRALKQEKQVLRPVRQPFWFEKFTWFLSSDGYLVVGGRDAQQRDTLYTRYMKKGDVFIHADLDGAIPLIVKNKAGMTDAPIPPTTLSQAGNLSVATSSTWDSKAMMSAWWVKAEAVTKKVLTGDHLGPGKFAIKTEKNFLPPAQLLLGLAVLFQISEDSKARHTKHRVPNDARITEPDQPSAENDGDTNKIAGEETAENEAEEDADGHDIESESEPEEEIEVPSSNPLQSQWMSANPPHPEDTPLAGEDISGSEASSEVEDMQEAQADVDQPRDSHAAGENPNPAPTGSQVSETQIASPHNFHNTSTKPSSDSQGPRPKPHNQQKPPETKSTMPVRGKKGKRKKIASKYADQDEEDRVEAMRLLGSAAGQEKAREEAAAKEARERELEAQRQRRREQHERAQRREADRERKAAMEDGGGDGEDEGEAPAVNVDLETLVGTPLPGDEIQLAVPVCAPWSALGRYKYKAKLQPGTTKKGKAVREVWGKWAADGQDKKKLDASASDTEKVWPREAELIKAWNEAEVFGVVPVGKVRVMMAGASGTGGKDAKKSGRGGRGGKRK